MNTPIATTSCLLAVNYTHTHTHVQSAKERERKEGKKALGALPKVVNVGRVVVTIVILCFLFYTNLHTVEQAWVCVFRCMCVCVYL